MVGLGFMLSGNETFLPVTIVGALAVAIAILVYVVNIWRCVGSSRDAAAIPTAVRSVT
jgi:hypothetical protein